MLKFMTKERVRFILPFALFIAILAVSTASIFIRFAQTDAPSLVIAALRLTFASAALAPIALTRHRAELQRLTRRELLLGLLSGLFLAVHFATWISSLEYTTVASSVVFVSTGPLWVALLSPFVLREPLTRPVLIGMSLALIGGIVVALSDACSWNNGIVCPSMKSNPAWTNGARKFSGAHRRVDGGRLFGDRAKIACEDVAHAVYLFGLWNGGDMFIDHRVHRARKSIRLSLDHVHLDFVVGARAAIDRSLNL